MEAFDYSLVKVFQPDVRFCMPLYQRPYVWKKDKQWAPLWDDIRGVAERLLAELDRPTLEGDPTPLERTPPHFLGAVVHGDGGGSHASVDRRIVIDGQQRLTTLQIILMVVRDAAADVGESKTAAQLRRLVENDESVVEDPIERWKVWPTNIDRAPFVAAWTENPTSSRFADARAYFSSEVVRWIHESEDGRPPGAKVEALGQVLQHRVHLVSIELQAEDNAQAIFETLNDRGEALLAADLVKNYSFQQAERSKVDLDALYRDTWEQFDSQAKWRREVRQGRLKRPRIDVFLQHWLSLSLGRDAGVSDLFAAYKELHRERQNPAAELLRQLSAAAGVFDRIDAAADDPPESPVGQFVHRWRTIEASTFTPALLCLFHEDVPSSQLEAGLGALESYLVRRLLCQWTTKQYNLLAIDLAVLLRDAPPGERGDLTRSFLAGHSADSRRWPTDDEVRDAVLRERAYRSIRSDRLKMVFLAVENLLRSEQGAESLLAQTVKLEVEHILPVSWKAYWRFSDGTTGALEQQIERDQALHRFGNLTITTGAINKDLRNYPWTEAEAQGFGLLEVEDYGQKKRSKRAALRTRSVLLLNSRLADEHPAGWDETSIVERGAWLAEQFIVIWGRPPVAPGSSSAPHAT